MIPALLSQTYFTLKDGGRMRYGFFGPTAAPRGTVLILPGRREFIEKKYEECKPLLDLGYRLIIVEPRGQGLSSRALEGTQRQRDHAEDFSAYLNDLRAFFAAIVLPEMSAPLFMHGHSLGGHMLLRWLAEDGPPITAAFFTAPMMALAGAPAHLAATGLSWAGSRLFGYASEYAPTQHDYGAEDKQFVHNPLTQDPERFRVIQDYFTAFPDLTVGGVTWGWMLAALHSMHKAQAKSYLGRIGAPVLCLIGGKDPVTPAREVTAHINHIPRAQTHLIDGARHDLLNEIDIYRDAAWTRIEAFLAAH